ncbi:MAG: HisA/HisF-related TIM barrel protein [Candidatus Limnocylindrales bacterium]
MDLKAGRSRLVFWPGASSGSGTPTDRPDRICRVFVDAGAPLVHLVDLDGAAAGRPVNTDAIQQVARAVATPLQLAGGIDGPDQIELAFAAGATRVVIPLWVAAESAERLADCVRAAGDWLAVGLDGRPERLVEYPWRRPVIPTLADLVDELVAAGVRRFILTHGGTKPDLRGLAALCRAVNAEILVAGGVTELATLSALRDAGVAGVILGEALFTGAIDYPTALAAAA